MRSLAPRYLVACAAFVVALSCGEVPTFPGGVAYVSPIIKTSLAVAAGDTLRDSTGKVTPLRVLAYDMNNQVVPNVAVTFVVTSVPPGVTIDANGIVVALDSIRTVMLVGQAENRLQTSPDSLWVVQQPDSIAKSGAVDSLVRLTYSSPLQVTVTGLRRGTRVPVRGITVRYQITKVNGVAAVDSALYKLVDDSKMPSPIDPRLAVATTDVNGIASRLLLPIDTGKFVSVEVQARATDLRGRVLRGSPVTFLLPAKKGP